MNIKTEDLRIRRTNKLLVEALFRLLEKQPFDDISVIDICNEAMVNRGTFYKHFEDKYHLLSFFFQSITEELKASYAGSENEDPRSYYMAIAKKTLAFFKQQRKIIALILTNSGGVAVVDQYHNIIVNEFMERYKAEEKNGVLYKVPIKYLAEYYTGAISGVIKWWLLEQPDLSEEQIVDYFELAINSDISIR